MMDAHYFLTGATGVLGSEILSQLITQNLKTTIVVRAKNENDLGLKIDKLRSYCKVGESEFNRLVRVLKGDLTQEKFSLSETDYSSMLNECTHIIHSAADLNFRKNLNEAIKEIDLILDNLFQFSSSLKRFLKMEFISTVGVAGKSKGLAKEHWYTGNHISYRNSYEAAKAHAERRAKAWSQQGFPMTVHRPSMIVGHSETGKSESFQVFAHICDFIAGKKTWGLVPNIDSFRIDTVPVDFVAASIIRSSTELDFWSPIIHECSGPKIAMSIAELRTMLLPIYFGKNYNFPVIPLPKSIFLSLLSVGRMLSWGKTKRRLCSLGVFLDYLGDDQTFDNENSIRWLNTNKLEIPNPQDYLDKSIRYYLNHAHR